MTQKELKKITRLRSQKEFSESASTIAFGHIITGIPMSFVSVDAGQIMIFGGLIMGIAFEAWTRGLSAQISYLEKS